MYAYDTMRSGEGESHQCCDRTCIYAMARSGWGQSGELICFSSSFLIDEMMPDDDETEKRNEAWFVPALIDDGLSRRDALGGVKRQPLMNHD